MLEPRTYPAPPCTLPKAPPGGEGPGVLETKSPETLTMPPQGPCAQAQGGEGNCSKTTPPLPSQALFSSELMGWGQERGGASLGRQDTCCVPDSL